ELRSWAWTVAASSTTVPSRHWDTLNLASFGPGGGGGARGGGAPGPLEHPSTSQTIASVILLAMQHPRAFGRGGWLAVHAGRDLQDGGAARPDEIRPRAVRTATPAPV